MMKQNVGDVHHVKFNFFEVVIHVQQSKVFKWFIVQKQWANERTYRCRFQKFKFEEFHFDSWKDSVLIDRFLDREQEGGEELKGVKRKWEIERE